MTLTPIKLENISKYRSEWMGIAILLVIFFHGYLPRESVFYGLKRMGNIGVDLFLCLSGIGLVFSFTKNSSVKHFFIQRYKRIYLTWLLIGGGFFLYQFEWHKSSVKGLITLAENVFFHLNFWKNGDLTFWYVPALMVLYCFTPFYIQALQRKKSASGWVLFPLLWCFLVAFVPSLKVQWGYLEIFWSRIPIFMLGLQMGFWVKNKKQLPAHYTLPIFLITMVSFIVAWWLEQEKHGLYPLFINRMLYIVVVLGGLSVFSMLFSHNSKKLNAGLRWIGNISLELYLIHLHWILVPLQRLHLSYFLTFALCCCMSIPMAWCVNKAITNIQKKIFS